MRKVDCPHFVFHLKFAETSNSNECPLCVTVVSENCPNCQIRSKNSPKIHGTAFAINFIRSDMRRAFLAVASFNFQYFPTVARQPRRTCTFDTFFVDEILKSFHREFFMRVPVDAARRIRTASHRLEHIGLCISPSHSLTLCVSNASRFYIPPGEPTNLPVLVRCHRRQMNEPRAHRTDNSRTHTISPSKANTHESETRDAEKPNSKPTGGRIESDKMEIVRVFRRKLFKCSKERDRTHSTSLLPSAPLHQAVSRIHTANKLKENENKKGD